MKTLFFYTALTVLSIGTGTIQATEPTSLVIAERLYQAKLERAQAIKQRVISQLKVDSNLDPRHALAPICAEKGLPKEYNPKDPKCWRYVKIALLASQLVNSYPDTQYAKEGIKVLTEKHGFSKLPVTDPEHAPIGSVLFYSTGRAIKQGHVEIKTKDGAISDFKIRHVFRGLFVENHGRKIFVKATFLGAYAKLASSSSAGKVARTDKNQTRLH
ncbi:MAG TPA: hypothetical protein VFA52_03260 [Candidatus Paceibacterota bacterium]|nr:hypothetical protein [Candidatus Paceibacterota bacterium]